MIKSYIMKKKIFVIVTFILSILVMSKPQSKGTLSACKGSGIKCEVTIDYEVEGESKTLEVKSEKTKGTASVTIVL